MSWKAAPTLLISQTSYNVMHEKVKNFICASLLKPINSECEAGFYVPLDLILPIHDLCHEYQFKNNDIFRPMLVWHYLAPKVFQVKIYHLSDWCKTAIGIGPGYPELVQVAEWLLKNDFDSITKFMAPQCFFPRL